MADYEKHKTPSSVKFYVLRFCYFFCTCFFDIPAVYRVSVFFHTGGARHCLLPLSLIRRCRCVYNIFVSLTANRLYCLVPLQVFKLARIRARWSEAGCLRSNSTTPSETWSRSAATKVWKSKELPYCDASNMENGQIPYPRVCPRTKFNDRSKRVRVLFVSSCITL